MTHTSESLKAMDGDFENYHYQLEDGERYELTDGERGWLDCVSGRYSIADHMWDNIEQCEETNALIYTVDTVGMGEALADDGTDCKAPCLSDDTALQAIFFYSAFQAELIDFLMGDED